MARRIQRIARVVLTCAVVCFTRLSFIKKQHAIAKVLKQEVGGDVAARNGHKGKLPGFIVLGMHRSGTSMLSGLLVEGFGYETGGPLIGAHFDNEKGFYERTDVVLQNDEFLTAQQAEWSFNVAAYGGENALQHKQQGNITFEEGESALKFLNNRVNAPPYLQKDPRMCITLPTWLKLLDETPAIVFTYRHPLEVAMSLKHREELEVAMSIKHPEQNFSIEQWLHLWIIYNMRAIQNSQGLCRVFSSNEAVLQDTLNEVQQIKNELTEKCHVIAPPNFKISEEVVNKFVDPNLQHNSNERNAKDAQRRVLKDFGGGCIAREFESNHPEKSPHRRAEVEMFLMAMQVFCDLENGKGYSPDYEWPDLAHYIYLDGQRISSITNSHSASNNNNHQ